MKTSSSARHAAKRKREHAQTNCVDRLSNLPDPVLQHILSFLTSRNAVQTCLLSKRWRSLWTSVPSLVLDLRDFDDSNANYAEKFVDFVQKLLQCRDKCDIDRFHLYCNDHNYEDCKGDLDLYPCVTEWIHYAVSRNVKELSVSFFYVCVDLGFNIPECIFTCSTLQELNLQFDTESEINFIPPKSIVLSCLKKLCLEKLDVGEMRELLTFCPLLEELTLKDCCLESPVIESHTIKSLTLTDCASDDPKIQICVPGLRRLCYIDCCFEDILLENLLSLEAAYFRGMWCDGGVNFIKGLSNVEELNLFESWIKDLPKDDMSQFPTFNNLKYLTLGGWPISDDFDAIALFLRHSPNLEMLSLIVESVNSKDDEEARWKERTMFFNCPKLAIIEIKIGSIKGGYLQLVDFLLANANTFTKMIINRF